MNKKKQLITQIQNAFMNTVMPEPDNIAGCPCDECSGIRRRFTGKHWTEITDPRNFAMLDVSLSLMTPDAFRYYLPAFLLGDLKGLGGKYSQKLMGYVFHLTMPLDKDKKYHKDGPTELEFFLSRVSGFNHEQKKALRSYLQFVYERRPPYDEDEELKRQQTLAFWQTFEG